MTCKVIEARTVDSARECGCEDCKRWWGDNVPGYFFCPMCREPCLESERYGVVCEVCFDELMEEE